MSNQNEQAIKQVLKLSTILNYVSDQATRVNVDEVRDWFGRIIIDAFPEAENRKELYKKMYLMFVVEAKNRKKLAKIDLSMAADQERGGLSLLNDAGEVLFTIVSGAGVRTNISEKTITYPMIQALITIQLNLGNYQSGLARAPLAFKVICKIQAALDNNWGIHGHGGMHFVASYIQDIYVTPNKPLGHMPSMLFLFGTSVGIDAIRSKDENKEISDTTRSYFTATGTASLVPPVLRATDWEAQVSTNAAKNKALLEVKKFASVFGGSAVAVTSSSSVLV